MKYSNMCVGWNNDSISMTLVCSKCEHEVKEDDAFCSKCGRKLKVLGRFISKQQILKLIEGKKVAPPKEEVLTIVGDVNPMSDSVSTSGGNPSTKTKPVCTNGRTSCSGCPLLTTDGYCTATVLTSYPPQYEKCMFSDLPGSQYKLCKDVGGMAKSKSNGTTVTYEANNEATH